MRCAVGGQSSRGPRPVLPDNRERNTLGTWVSPIAALFGRVTSRTHDLALANDRGLPCLNSVTLTRSVFRLRRKCAIIPRNDRG